MANYRYQALNADGKSIEGEIQADSVQQAVTLLEAAGMEIRSIVNTLDTSGPIDEPNGLLGGIRNAEQAALRSHLERVLAQGQKILPALRAYVNELSKGRRQRQLQTIIEIIDRGDVDEAQKAFHMLPEFWIPLLSASAGLRNPTAVLHEFLDESNQSDQLRSQWRIKLVYATFISFVAVAVLTFLSFLVIPVFRELFDDFGLDLPALTIGVLVIAKWITSGWIMILVIIVIVLALVIGRHLLLPVQLELRLNRFFGRKNAIARIARFTADLLESGFCIPDALNIASQTVHKSNYQLAAQKLADELKTGEDSQQLKEVSLLSAAVNHALLFNMSLESRIRLLREISVCHAKRLHSGLYWARGLIEPLTICVAGLVVLAVVVALYLPLVKLVSSLT